MSSNLLRLLDGSVLMKSWYSIILPPHLIHPFSSSLKNLMFHKNPASILRCFADAFRTEIRIQMSICQIRNNFMKTAPVDLQY